MEQRNANLNEVSEKDPFRVGSDRDGGMIRDGGVYCNQAI